MANARGGAARGGSTRWALVTGGAGGIGAHLVPALRARGWAVRVLDNFSSGRKENLAPVREDPLVEVVRADVTDLRSIEPAFEGVEFVWHLSANPDVRRGAAETDLDLQQGTVGTRNVLEAMRRHKVRKIAFSSSSVVYGHPKVFPTPEDYGPLHPESLYGASKLAGEALITAFCHSFDMQAWVFRFANVVGPGASHGVIYDFLVKLERTPDRLEVLGDGRQNKGYLWVEDCVEGMIYATEHAKERVNVFNLAPEDTVSVAEIAQKVIALTGARARIEFTGGARGWPGDVPVQNLSGARLRALGFAPKFGSKEVVEKAIRAMKAERKVASSASR
ncbi:MAG: SDR family NAD(P)-dependent oxidoreductase [Euryarchaeota archaeon]|nr:SDR family NAD(P)-dependent oxidoreductase [Euryarchaeota archaeon]MDE1834978.1 SDR family NAD(P)-dependent oxidoreductase [Euryarchaeota archaeon]MDE1880681.1 SDR family NAD(P)-dependent oxidoreductase [Euryarchaeota archaeon]MDE2046571.1 SDR family NAD(P)-dependent oxidoreductase [Thermoplasmata archaeon]